MTIPASCLARAGAACRKPRRGGCSCQYADPAVRARMSEAIKKALADPAVRARRSEASKKRLPVPVEKAEDYRVFRKAGFSKAEAMAMCGVAP